jgi:hypothetical protein
MEWVPVSTLSAVPSSTIATTSHIAPASSIASRAAAVSSALATTTLATATVYAIPIFAATSYGAAAAAVESAATISGADLASSTEPPASCRRAIRNQAGAAVGSQPVGVKRGASENELRRDRYVGHFIDH